MHNRHNQHELQLQEAAAAYIGKESNRQSLITVTRADLARHEDSVTFYVTVFPESAEGPALGFLLRKRGDVREYIKQTLPSKRVPHVEFALDEGDKHRRRVDDLLSQQ